MPEDAPPGLVRIIEAGELRVARNDGEEREPFFFRDSTGTWIGFDVDLAALIAEALCVSYLHVPADNFDEAARSVARREADLAISKLSGISRRGRYLLFSDPYLITFRTLLLAERRPRNRTPDPFAILESPGVARLGVQAGNAYHSFAMDLGRDRSRLHGFDDFASMSRALLAGEVDAVLTDSALASTWLKRSPKARLKFDVLIDRQRPDPMAIAVHWDDQHLLAWINLLLREMRDDGRLGDLYCRWFNISPPCDGVSR